MLCLRPIATETSHNQRADKCEAKASAYTFGEDLETQGYLWETSRSPSSGPRPPSTWRKNDYAVISDGRSCAARAPLETLRAPQ
jgi:hypothetical protein